MIELSEHEQLWDNLITARSEIADLRLSLIDLNEGISTLVNYTNLCLDHPEASEHRLWRRALLQNLERVQMIAAKAVAIEETETDNA